jgi:hypothetical protein
MNGNIDPRTSTLNKLILAGFVCLTFAQMVFRFQHHFTSLDTWNCLLTIAGFVFSVPRVFPGLVENPLYGLFSFLLRVKPWVSVTLCVLLTISLGLGLFLPSSQGTPNAKQTSPMSTPSTEQQPSPISAASSSSDSPSPTPVPTLSSSGTLVLNDSMANPASTDQWDTFDQPNAQCHFVHDAYDIKALPQQIDICKTEGTNTNQSDFIYEITMTIVKGSGAAGIVFRNQGPSSVSTDVSQQFSMTDVLLFDPQGNYSLASIGHQQQPSMTKTGRCSSFLRGLNQPNQIDVQVKGQTIDIFVNGTYLVSGQDNQLESGQMGVILMSGDDIAEATYSNFTVWKL